VPTALLRLYTISLFLAIQFGPSSSGDNSLETYIAYLILEHPTQAKKYVNILPILEGQEPRSVLFTQTYRKQRSKDGGILIGIVLSFKKNLKAFLRIY